MAYCAIPTKNVALRRISIRELEPDLDGILIVAVIINKQTPRKFPDRNNSELYRAVWNFTLRDSARDFINVTYWGTGEDVCAAGDKYYTGDVVELREPRVNVRKFNESSEQYSPPVTSPFSLLINDASQIFPYSGETMNFIRLLHFPTKPLSGYVPLRDIHNGGENMKGRAVDILGAVRKVGPIKNLKSKTGNEFQMCEVSIFDHTNSHLRLALWDIEIMTRATKWKPRTTILFITDAKIVWSTFLNTFTASITSRSIVTENPIGKEAEALASYAKTAPLENADIMDKFITDLPDPELIQNVMCVQQVRQKILNCPQSSNSDLQFTALLFVVVTQYDLDGPISVVRVRCSSCRNLMKGLTTSCESCSVAGTSKGNLDHFFDIRVNLTDHTGTLANCRLSGNVAEQLINCNPHQFLCMNSTQKARLKWKYLLERCAVRIAVLASSRFFPRISVVSCAVASPQEAAQRIPLC